MDTARLRKYFAEFLGVDRYRRFVLQINRRDRLRGWQQEVWKTFIATNSEFASLNDVAMRAAFRVCEVHGDEFQTYSTQVLRGNVDYSPDYCRAWSSLFPHSKHEFWSTEGMPFDGSTIELLFCRACCEAKSRWDAERAISDGTTADSSLW
jgi:hypothetical protein